LGVGVGAFVAFVPFRQYYLALPYEVGMTMEQCKAHCPAVDVKEISTGRHDGVKELQGEGFVFADEDLRSVEFYKLKDVWHDVTLYFNFYDELIRIRPDISTEDSPRGRGRPQLRYKHPDDDEWVHF
jgi:hypothetical protein